MGIINQIVFGVFLILILGFSWFLYKKGLELGKKIFLEYIILFGVVFLLFLSVFDYYFFSHSKKNVESSNIVFLLDVGKSMLVQDYGEYSRLQVAKGFIKSYVKNFPNNRYGLVLFSGEASSVIPLTSDTALFFQFLETADENSLLKSGSNFIEGLKESYTRFLDEPNGGAIIVLSDFETHFNQTNADSILSALLSIKNKFQKSNIRFIGIGIGDEKGGQIPESRDIWGNVIYKKDSFGTTVVSAFSKDFFEKIVILFAAESKHITSIMDLEKKYYFEIPSEYVQIEISHTTLFARYFLIVAYLFFLFYIFLFYYRQKNEKKNHRLV